MKSLALLLKRGGVLTALILMCLLDAHASVTVYAVWYPNGYNSPPQVAQNGATIGGWFYLRLRVQPQSGYIISASVTQSTLAEQTDVHPVTPTSPTFQSTQPNPAYGDPTGNVVVLQSQQNLADRHNGQYRLDVTVQYTVSTGNPPPNDRQTSTEVASFTFNVLNLLLVDSRAEPYFVWKPDEMSGVAFSAQLQHAQAGTCTVKVEIFRSDDNQNAVVVKEFANVSRPGSWSWTWDGLLDDGTVAPAGVYVYRLGAYVYGSAPPDRDSNRSDYLFIERAVDENNEPMLYAEYWGYDDKGTPADEFDDAFIYFIRWYSLYDTAHRNASAVRLVLFDPDVNPVGEWGIEAAPCIAHAGSADGLVAIPTDDDGDGLYDEDCPDGVDNDGDGMQNEDPAGAMHGLLFHLPTYLFSKSGEYRFLVYFMDEHSVEDKAHRTRVALGLNAQADMLPIRWIGNDEYRATQFQIVWVRIPLLRATNANVKGVKTNVLAPVSNTGNPDVDLPSVQHYIWTKVLAKARAGDLRKGTIFAAVNGTFFNHTAYPYPLVGRVGEGLWPWTGNPVMYCRWVFGISPSLSFKVWRMVLKGSHYDIPDAVSSFPFGLSGVGCLIHEGRSIIDPHEALEGFNEMDGRYARTLCAWTYNRHDLFLVWAKGDPLLDTGLGAGWTWVDARQFLTDFLPYGLYSMNRARVKQFNISDALMLDGGSHSDFIYIRIKRDVPALNGSDQELKTIIRNHYAEVHDAVTDGGWYVRGNRSLLQAYVER